MSDMIILVAIPTLIEDAEAEILEREETTNSDVDLLVVMDTDMPRGRRSEPIRKMLWKYDFPIDIIVRSPANLAKWSHVFGSLAYEIAKDGVILYERHKSWR